MKFFLEEALIELTKHAFEKCNQDDSNDGLSWKETEECEEEFCFLNFVWFLNLSCPTKYEFKLFDENEDGNLTSEEYLNYVKTNGRNINDF